MTIMKEFNIYKECLDGTKLIEASAGTGKTYTLAGLYLRYIVEKSLLPEQILVVTFTNAAASELKIRLREQLLLCLEHLNGNKVCEEEQPELYALFESYSQNAGCVDILNLALACFNNASIYTIHGFCQKVISDFNSYCGSLALNGLVRRSDVAKDIIYDYWREKKNRIPFRFMKLVPGPDVLSSKFDRLLNKSHFNDIKPSCIADDGPKLDDKLNVLTELWYQHKADILAYMHSGVFGRMFTAKSGPNYENAMDRFLDTLTIPSGTNYVERFCEGFLVNKASSSDVGVMPEFNCLFDDFYQQVSNYSNSFVYDCWVNLKDKLSLMLHETGMYSYDDLIETVYSSVKENPILSSKLGELYQCVMVDEFQDTDKLQYGIFDECFNSPGRSLIYVGDPKQSIYDFRGADIFVYQEARNSVESIYSLKTNWRSSKDMLAVTNRMFDFDESFKMNSIGFIPSESCPNQSEMLVDDQYGDSIAVIDVPANQRFDVIAGEIRRLLIQASISSKGALRSVDEGDIAVLVKSNSDAVDLYEYLISNEFNVSLSTDTTIFQTLAAKNMYYLLRCINSPTETNIYTSLNGLFFERDIKVLHAADSDELSVMFVNLKIEAKNIGLCEALVDFFDREAVFNRLLQKSDGERHYSDLQHLIELIQIQQDSGANDNQILQWLSKSIVEDKPLNDEDDLAKRRLESDGRKISIMTIHKSKGLEFGIVFIPFADKVNNYSIRSADVISCHDDEGHGVLDWNGSQSSIERYNNEREQETIRLLYVAMTRAKHRCYVGIDSSANGFTSLPVLPLYNNLVKMSGDDYLFTINGAELQEQSAPSPDLFFSSFNGRINEAKSVYSFSALASRQGHSYEHSHDSSNEVDFSNFFHFPKGALSGTLQHKIFELVDFTADKMSLTPIVSDTIDEFNFDPKWIDCLSSKTHDILNAPVGEYGFCLAYISNKIVEMEFLLPVFSRAESYVSQWLTKHRGENTRFIQDDLSGYFTGFIDLVAHHNDKFYIIDYKSNYLGDGFQSYGFDEMKESIHEHFYDLQYLLYTVALVIYLQSKMPGFDYEKHFGGIAYIYTRGVNGSDSTTGFYCTRPNVKLINEMMDVFTNNLDLS